MTQLIIAGVETVLPQGFSVTVKRENSFFTKSGEYTYDCTLRLDNPVNQQLYGFLHRLNKSSQIDTRRTAILMADGHVYCRGTEVVTKWTEQTVSIQIVSGNSELNYFIGSSLRLEQLDLGTIGTSIESLEYHWPDARDLPNYNRTYGNSDYCMPLIRNGNTIYNNVHITDNMSSPFDHAEWDYWITDAMPQPYLCAILRRLITALGYTIGVNQLEDTQFRNLFLVNTIRTTEYAKMFPGWEVKNFLVEVERLCGVVFLVDNLNRTCDILQKTVFYQNARQLTLANVVDEYEMQVETDNNDDADWTSANVTYDIPKSQYANLMKLPEGYTPKGGVVIHNRLSDILNDIPLEYDSIHKVDGDDRLYIVTHHDIYNSGQVQTEDCLLEINQFRDLLREDSPSTLTLKITPAPMVFFTKDIPEIIDIESSTAIETDNSASEALDNDGGEEEKPIEQQIQEYTKQESSAGNIRCAFLNEFSDLMAYTDASHVYCLTTLYPFTAWRSDEYHPEGSLRLQDLDTDYYQGGYQIDTAHAVTFETFDPNHIDVRQVYIIGNRRYVVRDAEETITAEGRQPLWRLTCYPIRISDESIEHRWILTRGAWDDGGAWLDDGRWNDQTPH